MCLSVPHRPEPIILTRAAPRPTFGIGKRLNPMEPGSSITAASTRVGFLDVIFSDLGVRQDPTLFESAAVGEKRWVEEKEGGVDLKRSFLTQGKNKAARSGSRYPMGAMRPSWRYVEKKFVNQ